MKLAWSERAIAQLEQAVSAITDENPAAAWRVYDRIVEKAGKLTQLPLMGREGRERGTRELVITGTRYALVYRVVGETIEIAAVWHGAQSRKR